MHNNLFSKFLLSLVLLSGHIPCSSQANHQSVIITVIGNGNVINVKQSNGPSTDYNLDDRKQAEALLQYLKHFTKLDKIINRMAAEVHDTYETVRKLKSYLEEHTLSIEKLEQLSKKETEPDLSQLLAEANAKLNEFDNDSYQQIMETYKLKKINILKKASDEVAYVSYLQANNYYFNYNFRQALLEIDSAISIDEKNFTYLLLKLQITDDLSLTDQFRATEKLIRSQVTCENEFMTVYFFLASCATERHNQHKRMEYFNALLAHLSKSPDSDAGAPPILDQLGELYAELGYYDKALSQYFSAMRILGKYRQLDDWQAAPIYDDIAAAYIEQGQNDNALHYALLADKVTDNGAPFNLWLKIVIRTRIASLYQQKGWIDRALGIYTDILDYVRANYGELHPYMSTIYSQLGKFYWKAENNDSAAVWYKKAVDINTVYNKQGVESATTYNDLAVSLDNLGQTDSAMVYFNKAIETLSLDSCEDHSYTPSIYTNYANCLCRAGKFREALYYFRKLTVRSNRPSMEAYQGMMACYENLKIYDSAATCCLQVVNSQKQQVQSNEEYTNLLFELTWLYFSCGKKDSAISYLEKEACPTCTLDNKVVLFFNWGCTSFENKDYSEAISFYKMAIEYAMKAPARCSISPGEITRRLEQAKDKYKQCCRECNQLQN